MQAAIGELPAQVRRLQAQNTPAEVIVAWTEAVRILLAHRPGILGSS
jgi:hypothetical protein